MNPPQLNEFAPFYTGYIQAVGDDVFGLLESQTNDFPALLKSIRPEKADYVYAEGKWTIKELIGHIIDTERIMTYRITCVARNDKTLLPGFEENDYVLNTHFSDRTIESFAEEFSLLRRSNLFLFKSFTEDELNRLGNANGHPISARALLFIIAGHLNHHVKILKERYL
ncbi:MAG: hypothetical protein JWN56_2641 [Sphingobacteriales bacterium]|nr:hypothetical protein [Sphingobacteriales bacterium]